MVNSRFELYLKRKLLKRMNFDLVTQEFKIERIALSSFEKKEIFDEGKLYNYSKYEVEGFINNVINSDLTFNPTIDEMYSIDFSDLELGQHIKISYELNNKYRIDELLKIGPKEYLLISHGGEKLMAGDMLHLKISGWSIGEHIEFEVYRDDEKIFSPSGSAVYTLKNIEKIDLVYPSELFNIVENKFSNQDIIYAPFPNDNSEFIINETSIECGNDKFYKINRVEGKGTFSFVTRGGGCSEIDILRIVNEKETIIDRACDCGNRLTANIKKVLTVQEGIVRLNRSKETWEIVERAIIQFE